MEKQVITVTGPVAASQMGITDAHNHLWISPVDCPALDAPVLNQQEAIVAELQTYRQAGGGGQIDCQPYGCGRDGNKLHQLAQASGVHVVANTGFHLREYSSPDNEIWQMDEDQACEFFIGEIKTGLMETRADETPVYPGFIKIAVRETLAESPVQLMAAAAQASLTSGLIIEMHTQKGQSVEDFVEFFDRQGLPPQQLVICHIDKRPDHGLHMELARAGYMLEYDTFFRPKYQPEENLWPLLQDMVEQGLARSLALATDMADSSMWQKIDGGVGITALITGVKGRLAELNYDEEIIMAMIGGNIVNRLAVTLEEKVL